jgi:hypothetical protein
MEIVVIAAYSRDMQMWYDKSPRGEERGEYFAILLHGNKKMMKNWRN